MKLDNKCDNDNNSNVKYYNILSTETLESVQILICVLSVRFVIFFSFFNNNMHLMVYYTIIEFLMFFFLHKIIDNT